MVIKKSIDRNKEIRYLGEEKEESYDLVNGDIFLFFPLFPSLSSTINLSILVQMMNVFLHVHIFVAGTNHTSNIEISYITEF